MRRVALLIICCLPWLGLAERAAAEESSPWRTRVRLDSVLRWAPRYVVEVDRTEWAADRLFWRRVDILPLYFRVGLDSNWSPPESSWAADVHASAWAGLALTLDQTAPGLAAGDFALAYGRVTYKPVTIWAGRRFVPWGPPGGLHLDGGGLQFHTPFGLIGEAVIGRPVTPVYDNLLGVQPSFAGATLAHGLRLGYRHPGRLSASLAYSERWSKGIAADRLFSAEITAVPTRRLDLRGSLVFDPAERAVEQASGQVFVLVTDLFEVDAGYAYADPSRLIPKWSLLSAFASGAFHEASLGTTLDVAEAHFVRVEGAGRRYIVPGRADSDHEARWWGYRLDLVYRWVPRSRHFQLRTGLSRRADEVAGLSVLHGAFGWAFGRRFETAVEGALSMEDDRNRARDSYLSRFTFAVEVARHWHLSLSLDGARTAFVKAELRGMVRATWQPAWQPARERRVTP